MSDPQYRHYSEAILAKLILDDSGVVDLEHRGNLLIDAVADLTEDEANWLEWFQGRVLA